MPVDLVQLNAELWNDPMSLGYRPHIDADEFTALADMLNLWRSSMPLYRNLILQGQMQEALVRSEYEALSPVRQLLWDTYTRIDIDFRRSSDPFLKSNVRYQIESLFEYPSSTVDALQNTVWLRDASRAENIWEVGIVVSWQQVQEALQLPRPPLTQVPLLYTPKLDLPWAVRASHIWAVHPSNPLRADKGGLTLELVNPANPPIALGGANTMQFSGGSHNTKGFYRTAGTFIWGDNPVLGGNQTPPMIGAMSCWVQFNSFANYEGFLGGENTDGTTGFTTAHFVCNASGNIFGLVNGLSVAGMVSPYTWHHVAITNDGSFRRVYIDGNKSGEAAQDSTAGADIKFRIGSNMWGGVSDGNLILNGGIRLVAVVQGSIWTDAEIMDQFQHPYAYYEG